MHLFAAGPSASRRALIGSRDLQASRPAWRLLITFASQLLALPLLLLLFLNAGRRRSEKKLYIFLSGSRAFGALGARGRQAGAKLAPGWRLAPLAGPNQ